MMELFQSKSKWIAWLGLALMALPAYFVLAMAAKYNLGIDALYGPWGYFLEDSGRSALFNQLSPWLFGGGLVLAFVLNLLPLLRVKMSRAGDEVTAVVTLKARIWNLALVGLSGLVGLAMLAYLVVENL
jgi:hypothetical protein